tara:strand:- start:574 stop:1392 length:819 start_codon:yes stop_codon:yes gene_type:complete
MPNGNQDAIEKAIEAGMSPEDIAADLADDGILNNSHITGLTATEKNTSALEKATEAAKQTHKLLTALIPILILLASSGLELSGFIDLTPAGDDDGDEWFWEDDEGNEYDEMYWGCTNDAAPNYDPDANVDDGSCEPLVEGCTDPEANNYNEDANEDDGSCEYEPEECEPFYYDYYMSYSNNNTSLTYTYDVDLPCDETQQVELQFLAYANNSSQGDAPENYSIDEWDVYNGDYEYRNMTIGLPKGFYDIYAYIINKEGVMQDEKIWTDIEIE